MGTKHFQSLSITLLLQEAGRILKELLGSESLGFYVSPFVRSKQTYEEIRTAFTDDQVNACVISKAKVHSNV